MHLTIDVRSSSCSFPFSCLLGVVGVGDSRLPSLKLKGSASLLPVSLSVESARRRMGGAGLGPSSSSLSIAALCLRNQKNYTKIDLLVGMSDVKKKFTLVILAKVSDWNSFRVNQNYSDICIRTNANHSATIRKTFCILFDEKRSKINPI